MNRHNQWYQQELTRKENKSENYDLAPRLQYLRPNHNKSEVDPYCYKGIVVLKIGCKAIVSNRNGKHYTIPNSQHLVGHWISFELDEDQINRDGYLVDINRVKVIEPQLPTFTYSTRDSANRREILTAALFIDDPEQVERFVLKGKDFKNCLDCIPKIIYWKCDEENRSLSGWKFCKDLGNSNNLKLFSIEDRHLRFDPEEYIEKVKKAIQWVNPVYQIPADLIVPDEEKEILKIIRGLLNNPKNNICDEMDEYDPRGFNHMKKVCYENF